MFLVFWHERDVWQEQQFPDEDTALQFLWAKHWHTESVLFGNKKGIHTGAMMLQKSKTVLALRYHPHWEARLLQECARRHTIEAEGCARCVVPQHQDGTESDCMTLDQALKQVQAPLAQLKGCTNRNNKVTVYYWPAGNKIKRTGHVAMRTHRGGPSDEGYYISFWPKGSKQLLRGQFTPSSHHLNSNELEDYEAEGEREPQETHLYTLDVDVINNEFARFKQSGCKFHLLGAIKMLGGNPDSVSESWQCCSGVVFDLLYVGGLPMLIPNLGAELETWKASKSMDTAAHHMRGLNRVACRSKNPVVAAALLIPVVGVGAWRMGEVTYNYLQKKDLVFTPKRIWELAMLGAECEKPT
eukprot:TRINITY_DN67258_c0_g1_i1.p1 TRINITY_DN67258_c0_g1~~TRINITY_DN67258_c0_g1_i1.p1  ORF type:complete len:356 (-),score=13.24 TRINITY_DN67258_c0_g1_i1:345-1412(-)